MVCGRIIRCKEFEILTIDPFAEVFTFRQIVWRINQLFYMNKSIILRE